MRFPRRREHQGCRRPLGVCRARRDAASAPEAGGAGGVVLAARRSRRRCLRMPRAAGVEATSDSNINASMEPRGELERKVHGGRQRRFGAPSRAREMQTARRLGYATAGNDTGHSAAMDRTACSRWAPEKIVDFAYRAMHEMTATSKS